MLYVVHPAVIRKLDCNPIDIRNAEINRAALRSAIQLSRRFYLTAESTIDMCLIFSTRLLTPVRSINFARRLYS